MKMFKTFIDIIYQLKHIFFFVFFAHTVSKNNTHCLIIPRRSIKKLRVLLFFFFFTTFHWTATKRKELDFLYSRTFGIIYEKLYTFYQVIKHSTWNIIPNNFTRLLLIERRLSEMNTEQCDRNNNIHVT